MSAQDWTAAPKMRRITDFNAVVLRATVVLAAASLAFGCAADLPGPTGPDPSDPRARVPAVGYRSAVAPYESLRPVEPAPWVQQNQQIAPQPKR